MTALVNRAWGGRSAFDLGDPRDRTSQGRPEAVQTLVVSRLMDLSARADADPAVRHIASAGLRRLAGSLTDRTDPHGAGTRDDIERFLSRPDQPRKKTIPPAAPPGEPIG